MKIYLTEKQFKKYVLHLKEETVGVLIKKLQKFPKDMNIDCNDGNGGYSSIKDVKKQDWEEGGRKHETVTIVHDKSDHNESIVESLCKRLMCEDDATPNNITVYDKTGNELIDWYCNNKECKPIPFGYDLNDNLHIGQVGDGHSDIEKTDKTVLYGTCGRLWQNGKYVTIWGWDMKNNRDTLSRLYNDIQKFNFDLSNSLFIYEENNIAMVVPVIKFIGGGQGIPFTEYLESKKSKPIDMSPWAKMPGDSEFEKKENWYAWNGRKVDESAK